MKKFLIRLLIFLIMPLLAVVLVDFHLRTMNTAYLDKITGLNACKDSVEVLVLGNSHAFYGVNPAKFSLYAYNLASVNQSLYFDKRLTLKFLDDLRNLKYVLISVDYHSLYFSSQGSRDVWAYYGHGIPYKDNNYIKEIISPFLFGYTPIVSATVMTRDLKRRIVHRGENTIDFDVEEGVDITIPVYHGFYPLHGSNDWKFSEESYRQRLSEFWWTEQVPGEYDDVMADLKDFIGVLKNKGVTPVLFCCPTYWEYNKLLNEEILAKNSKAIESLERDYGVVFLNYMEDIRFTQDKFFNCDHLNSLGADMFSEYLSEDLMHMCVETSN